VWYKSAGQCDQVHARARVSHSRQFIRKTAGPCSKSRIPASAYRLAICLISLIVFTGDKHARGRWEGRAGVVNRAFRSACSRWTSNSHKYRRDGSLFASSYPWLLTIESLKEIGDSNELGRPRRQHPTSQPLANFLPPVLNEFSCWVRAINAMN